MKRLEKKHPLAIRWFHWINFPVLFVMIWSGLCIYWANQVYRIGFGSRTLFAFFPDWFYHPRPFGSSPIYHLNARLAEGLAWHFMFMWFFFLNGLLYVLYTAISGEWRALVPNRHSFREALQVMLYDLKLSKVPPPRRKFNGAQQIAYTSIILMGLGSLLTGLAIYKPAQFAWLTALLGGYQMARFFHFWLTMGYIA
ncbi:MAG TPA: cytochrome b/b6 domain-containing protein, partial [Chthonomonadaceae bacterium]|nr:cytochrome b/b6 domain-containing protein [Chthonomonadaceae bacterium]